MLRLAYLLGCLLFIASPAFAQFTGGGSGGTGGAGDVGSVSASTATNPSTEATLKEITLTSAALNTADKKLLVHASGRYTTAAAQTPTMRFRVYLCTVSGCGSGTVVTLADFTTAATTASTTNSWQINGSIGTITAGATGTVESKFWQQAQLGAAGDLTPEVRLDQNNAASASIDLTGVLYVRTTVLMSSANAGNSVTQRMGWVDGGAGTGGGGSGAPTDATYIMQTANGSTSAEQALSALATGILKNTTSTGVLSIAAAGTDYVAPAGNVATATALAANGANCSAGQYPLGVDASGAVESCTAVGSASIVHTFQALTANGSISGTHKFVTCDATTAAVVITLPAATAVAGADFQVKKIDASVNTCTVTRAGTDLIDGGTTAVLRSRYETIGVASDGTSAWSIF